MVLTSDTDNPIKFTRFELKVLGVFRALKNLVLGKWL